MVSYHKLVKEEREVEQRENQEKTKRKPKKEKDDYHVVNINKYINN
jgi:hypothetical protein